MESFPLALNLNAFFSKQSLLQFKSPESIRSFSKTATFPTNVSEETICIFEPMNPATNNLFSDPDIILFSTTDSTKNFRLQSAPPVYRIVSNFSRGGSTFKLSFIFEKLTCSSVKLTTSLTAQSLLCHQNFYPGSHSSAYPYPGSTRKSPTWVSITSFNFRWTYSWENKFL